MTAPLAIDLYCGLGGWTRGLQLAGWRVIGFDLSKHCRGRYPGQLVLQDVQTLDGAQLRAARLIVASPPCQAFSYRAMPWSRARALPPPDTSLFERCFQLRAEAEQAAGRVIPLVIENVRGAEKWVGRAKWHYRSFYLWGDVPALMPIPVANDGYKQPGLGLTLSGPKAPQWNRRRRDARFVGGWWDEGIARHGSKSEARRSASAEVAQIPLPLAKYIGLVYLPRA